MGTEKKLSLIFELSHEFELNTQAQNSPKMSHLTQNSNSILKLIFLSYQIHGSIPITLN
jgi:hypothetical protein